MCVSMCLEVELFVSHLMWVLGVKLQSPGKVVYALNCQALPPAPPLPASILYWLHIFFIVSFKCFLNFWHSSAQTSVSSLQLQGLH